MLKNARCLDGYNDGYKFVIEDDDFTEDIVEHSVWEAIIAVYERRGLNVPTNMMRYIIRLVRSGSISYEMCFKWLEEFGSRRSNFHIYRKEFEKYLILI
jgi:hypothetical protein